MPVAQSRRSGPRRAIQVNARGPLQRFLRRRLDQFDRDIAEGVVDAKGFEMIVAELDLERPPRRAGSPFRRRPGPRSRCVRFGLEKLERELLLGEQPGFANAAVAP